MKLVGSLQSYKMEPLIVFSFSRRDCEAYSLACANPDMGDLCFATPDEAVAIEEVGWWCGWLRLGGMYAVPIGALVM